MIPLNEKPYIRKQFTFTRLAFVCIENHQVVDDSLSLWERGQATNSSQRSSINQGTTIIQLGRLISGWFYDLLTATNIGSSIPHETDQYRNNIVEISHQPTRQRERQMRKVKSPGQAHRFLACHAVINNHFRLQRHLLKARHYQFFRERAFDRWSKITCAQNLVMA